MTCLLVTEFHLADPLRIGFTATTAQIVFLITGADTGITTCLLYTSDAADDL